MRVLRIVLVFLATASFVGCGDDGGSGDGGADNLFDAMTPGTVEPGDPCNGTIDCTPGSICFSNICVNDGTVRFSLAWNEDTDFDLHVLTPNGEEIYYSAPTGTFGMLDVDDCVMGDGCRLPEYKHVENVFFSEDAERGVYEFWVQNYDGVVAGSFTVVAAENGNVQSTHTGSLPAEMVDSEHFTFTY